MHFCFSLWLYLRGLCVSAFIPLFPLAFFPRRPWRLGVHRGFSGQIEQSAGGTGRWTATKVRENAETTCRRPSSIIAREGDSTLNPHEVRLMRIAVCLLLSIAI